MGLWMVLHTVMPLRARSLTTSITCTAQPLHQHWLVIFLHTESSRICCCETASHRRLWMVPLLARSLTTSITCTVPLSDALV